MKKIVAIYLFTSCYFFANTPVSAASTRNRCEFLHMLKLPDATVVSRERVIYNFMQCNMYKTPFSKLLNVYCKVYLIVSG